MTYLEMKEEFINIKKEEFEFIKKFLIINQNRKLTEYDILTICRRSYYYEKKINDLLYQMREGMFQEQRRLKKEGKLDVNSVVLEFDIDSEFLSLIDNEILYRLLWIDPKTKKFRLEYSHPLYRTYPLNFLNKEKRVEGIYLYCGISDISDSITHEEDLRGIYYYLDYYNKIEIPFYEIYVDEIKEFENNKIIIKNEPYISSKEVKKIFDEEFLNDDNKSMEDIARMIHERIHELSHSRYLRNVKTLIK